MDYPQECVCGRSFSQVNAMSNHRRTCKKSKSRLSSAISSAQDNWRRKKARILEHPPVDEETKEVSKSFVSVASTEEKVSIVLSIATAMVIKSESQHTDPDVPQNMDTEPATREVSGTTQEAGMIINSHVDEISVDERSIAERKPSRAKVRPKRYDDAPPESTPGFISLTKDFLTEAQPAKPRQSITSRIRNIFKSPRNIFGLSRTYVGHQPPDHDPEQSILPDDFIEPPKPPLSLAEPLSPPLSPLLSSVPSGIEKFHPYPNRSSYLLGHWYWCDGVQKSQQSFDNLIDIVGDPKFNAADIRGTKWGKINNTLGEGGQMDQPTSDEWEDEELGWVKTPVTIGVPFTQCAKHPGPKNYTIPGFHHRHLISVIKEKLANVEDHQHFHYEPFELHWLPQGGNMETRVYGELYSSPEFIKVHAELQDLPRDTPCELPRVVLALMFWSDTTHLTSFGKAQLWPLYMGFGNESKYRRCRPSLHLLNHVAYFEKVWIIYYAPSLTDKF